MSPPFNLGRAFLIFDHTCTWSFYIRIFNFSVFIGMIILLSIYFQNLFLGSEMKI